MEINRPDSTLDADRPCKLLKDDLLNRAGQVRGIRAAILHRPDRETMVFSIQGPWGCGKSSFLAFLGEDLVKVDNTIVFNFDPWWFSSADDLIVRFFYQLQTVLGRQSNDKYKRVASAVGTLAKLSQPMLALVPGGTLAAVAIEEGAKAVGQAQASLATDVWSIREEIEELLSDEQTSIVVMIDDLDRLTKPEINNIFRLVKGISALKGMVFVLAFDQGIVAKALEDSGGVAYLEKIVQCPFELAPPTQRQLQQVAWKGLKPLLSDALDSDRWFSCYHKLIGRRLTTFRNVKRLVNACLSTYRVVANEVDPIDFVLVQFLRIFEPELYLRLSDYTNATQSDGFSWNETPRSPADWVLALYPPERHKPLKELLEFLFPHSRDSSMLSLGRNLPTYFRLTPEEGSITNSEWHRLKDCLKLSPIELIDQLNRSVDSPTMLASILERLESLVREPGLDQTVANNITEAVVAASSQIFERGVLPSLLNSLVWTMENIFLFSVRQQALNRWHWLYGLLHKTQDCLTVARFTLSLDHPEFVCEVYSKNDLASLQKWLPRFKKLAVSKISLASESRHLWTYSRSFVFLLEVWQNWNGLGKASVWLRDQLNETPDKLPDLVSLYMDATNIYTLGHAKAQRTLQFQESNLETLLKHTAWKPSTLKSKLNATLRTQTLTSEQRQTLNWVLNVNAQKIAKLKESSAAKSSSMAPASDVEEGPVAAEQ